eukprot:6207404-Pleurochrysis_carterae.AAC.3
MEETAVTAWLIDRAENAAWQVICASRLFVASPYCSCLMDEQSTTCGSRRRATAGARACSSALITVPPTVAQLTYI